MACLLRPGWRRRLSGQWAAWILACFGGVFFCAVSGSFVCSAPQPSADDEVLQFLNQTTDWYRRILAVDQNTVTSEGVLYRSSVRASAQQASQAGFDFARAQAALLTDRERAIGPTTARSGSNRARALTQAAAKAADAARQVKAQLDAASSQLSNASGEQRSTLAARKDKLSSELDLINMRQDVLKGLLDFMSERENSSASTLLEQVDDLEHSLPDLDKVKKTAATSSAAPAAANASEVFRPQSAGLIGLVTEMFSLTREMVELSALADQATALEKENRKLLLPIRQSLLDAVRRGDAIANEPESDGPSQLEAQRKQIEALKSQFKLLSDASVPLDAQHTYLVSTRINLQQWHKSLGSAYTTILRYLLVRLGGMAIAIVVLLGISTIWRRATFRYVKEPRRRVQFLLVRRIVVGVVLVLIVLASVITEFGSLATFAGIMTAGVAVALQTFIVSGVAYFFFMGRYGVRVGDRVTVAGITGDVIDIGLFRLYLMELSGVDADRHPTGRIVFFSNSVLFQPQAFFKQIPGADYNWQKIALTLAPDSDYHLAESRLTGAVESVYAGYRDEIERQYEAIKHSIQVHVPPPRPEGRLRFVDNGIEFSVRYPVDIGHSQEIEQQMTQALLDAIDKEPKLKLIASTTSKV